MLEKGRRRGCWREGTEASRIMELVEGTGCSFLVEDTWVEQSLADPFLGKRAEEGITAVGSSLLLRYWDDKAKPKAALMAMAEQPSSNMVTDCS